MGDSDERCLAQPLRVLPRGPLEEGPLLEYEQLKEMLQSGPRLQEALGDWLAAWL
jgi:hypothetical protein